MQSRFSIYIRQIFTTTLLLGAVCCGFMDSQALAKPKITPPIIVPEIPPADTVIKPKPVVPRQGSIEAVINPSTRRERGLITTISQGERQYFIIPASLMGKDILVVNRLSQASALLRTGFDGYAGDLINESMIRFKPSDDGKNVYIELISTKELPRDTTSEMYHLVLRSNMQPIGYTLPVRGRDHIKDSILMDATEFLNSETELISFSPSNKSKYKLNGYQRDKSYVSSMKSYPTNTELRTVKTYLANIPSQSNPSRTTTKPVTFEINSSFVLLPENPMTPRYADPRVGYFTEQYIDYDQDPQGVRQVSMITRYRMEPKAEDVERYLRGELVEPKKPLIYYIDPLTPKKWVPYLIQGVNDWQAAFEKAGFKNAIQGRIAPTSGDSTYESWSLEDSRFSAIVYKPSDIPNASGPHVRDPRTGEIIESHINWYHNVMQLVKRWYMIQVGPNDPQARQINFPDSLMGELIRFISSHEVGHTLGLKHNFGATSCVKVDSLRSRTFLAKYGHTPSIMDYSRFNYVAQPEDSISHELLYPRIQDYDHWAIEYGYRWYPGFENPAKEKEMLCEWITKRIKDNPRLWFGHERNPSDPRSQAEDLGDNQMVAAELGVRNLIRVANKLPQWTVTPGQGYANLKVMYDELTKQYIVYNWNVAKWVGGVFENPSVSTDQMPVYTHVDAVKQREALKFLNQQFFRTPMWLFNQNTLNKIGLSHAEASRILQLNIFGNILNTRVLSNLINAETLSRDAFTMNDLYTELNTKIFSELSSQRKPDLYRRMLHKTYISSLMELAGFAPLGQNGDGAVVAAKSEYADISDIQSMAIYQLQQLQSRFATATSTDPVTKAHYQYLATQIKQLFK